MRVPRYDKGGGRGGAACVARQSPRVSELQHHGARSCAHADYRFRRLRLSHSTTACYTKTTAVWRWPFTASGENTARAAGGMAGSKILQRASRCMRQNNSNICLDLAEFSGRPDQILLRNVITLACLGSELAAGSRACDLELLHQKRLHFVKGQGRTWRVLRAQLQQRHLLTGARSASARPFQITAAAIGGRRLRRHRLASAGSVKGNGREKNNAQVSSVPA